jgi:hypothetical protein
MKKIVLLAITALSAFGADTNTIRVFTTNYVVAASNFREVDGQLYNVNQSVKWQPVRCHFQNYYGEFAVFKKVEHVKIGEYEAHETHNVGLGDVGAYSAPVKRTVWSDVETEVFLVKHFPVAQIAKGAELNPRLMQVGETNYEGQIVGLYDCGAPHIVPVVTTHAPPNL